MKFTLKLLLVLLLIIAAIYTASPLWLPQLLNRQLPAGWQLEQINTGYPGIAGIKVPALKIKGSLQTADITITATGIDLSYRGFKTDVTSMTLNVIQKSARDTNFDPSILDNLSLPVMNLSGKIPELSVSHLSITLDHVPNDATGLMEPAHALTLNLGSLNFAPGPENSYHLVTDISFETIPVAPGLLELDIDTHSLNAEIHFPADVNTPKWFSVSANQTSRDGQPNTRVQAVLNTAAADQRWIDSILARGSGGLFNHIDGLLQASAEFAGPGPQRIQQFSLDTENLRLEAEGETLEVKTSLLARHGPAGIHISLHDQTVIQYGDRSGKIDRLLTGAFPQFQRAPRAEIEASLTLESGSEMVIKEVEPLAFQFTGDMHFGFDSGDETVVLDGNDISVVVTDFPRLESMTVDGQAHVEWEEGTATKFTLPNLEVAANGLSLSADITSMDGTLLSTGTGSLLQVSLADMSTSAKRMDIRWQQLDIHNMSGHFFTQTHGFRNTGDGDTWTGFDFNLNYQVLNGEKVDGSGKMTFDTGPGLPIDFNGNINLGQWKITLPPTSIKPSQLVKLLKIAQADLPASFKLTDGLLDMQGEIIVDDGVRAALVVNAHELDASIKESRADDIDFNFQAVFDQDVSIEGPLSIEKIALAGGIDLTEIKAQLGMTGVDRLMMKDIQAGVFEGRLYLANLQYANNEIADTRADFTHINLDSILAFADINGLQGTGHLDVSLPISQGPAGLVISKGTFSSTGPGRLSYAKEGAAPVNIGMQALENFYYKQLSGTINYEADGRYQIAIRLEGSNPDLYDGYPVIFNLNISGIMPELFESMFITGSFEEAILNQVKTR